ncbi:unnamed protein product [Oppiella nova]|uniref:Farnesyl pyrophosphate synthase n=1 Tax=Oppiella nova TaxID=334625 RepID=A0A7R9QQ23_9ACAR|nr:unnamed protein product [Oppiella nova]CAG2170803.1 unnamed protein product [Oppiella nova]
MENKVLESLESTYRVILDKISIDTSNKGLLDVRDRLEKIVNYNVGHGKGIRALFVMKTYILLAKHKGIETTKEDIELAQILGAIQHQTGSTMLDDVGLHALNDGEILKNECFHTLKLFFGHKKSYPNIMETFHEMMRYTTYGQHMDMASNPNNTGPRFDLFTKSRYETIVRYKTSYYTFVLPVRLAMYLFGMKSKSSHREAEELLIKIGYLFQMQDDFIDCFGDPIVTGKQGSDIVDGKCCWPVVRALELCDESQRRHLVANYGIKCEQNVNKCKEIYRQLNLKDLYLKEELTIYEEICGDLQNLKNANEIRVIDL